MNGNNLFVIYAALHGSVFLLIPRANSQDWADILDVLIHDHDHQVYWIAINNNGNDTIVFQLVMLKLTLSVDLCLKRLIVSDCCKCTQPRPAICCFALSRPFLLFFIMSVCCRIGSMNRIYSVTRWKLLHTTSNNVFATSSSRQIANKSVNYYRQFVLKLNNDELLNLETALEQTKNMEREQSKHVVNM